MSARILIVDDTPLNVKLLQAKLAHDYYIISTAENGVEALAKVASAKPDLILLDVMMPEMDGFETCRRLKADPATAYIPVVMITALSDVADRVRGLAAGADDFLGKPINDLALMARIRSLLRMKVLMDEWRLREATALQLSPFSVEPLVDPLDVRDSRVLIVDDDNDAAVFIRETLTPLSAFIAHVSTANEAEDALANGGYDLVFSNLDRRDEDGLEICARLRTNPATRHVPLLLLAGSEEMDRVAKGLDLGANDYLVRPFDAQELFARARAQLRHKRNYDRLREGLERNLMMALIDPLTGAFNRRYLDAHLPRFLQHAADARKPLSVQMIDIDFFKKVNDSHGHGAGDAVLKEVARRISSGVRPSDFFVRMGGEEFAVVMPEIDLPSAMKIADRLRQSIEGTPIVVEDVPEGLTVTISIGVAETNPDTGNDREKIFDRADAALFKAKQGGRNRVVGDGAQP
ncbi:MAG: PleD family two-component system response regulator [Alphaproteobacteria bacterium]|nr:PleD family two-component system response regulator [Alphaproteobacteria bacterium]